MGLLGRILRKFQREATDVWVRVHRMGRSLQTSTVPLPGIVSWCLSQLISHLKMVFLYYEIEVLKYFE
jgi:hypothetical protein